ncbi:hypothetical protein [Georgenia subflava]|uniref:Uncharacterized protein n=1 Tax=Georgenia subflava TaxID=1622177 RepID=A0A6N7EB21_9MICO|nr:hypothetical protein [Georgenia subflava]MPV35582.1 hypothetical protein [Georgenia subflava]
MDDRRDRLRRKYLSLGAGELVAAALFAGGAAWAVAPRLGIDGTTALWCALVPLLVVLVQAGAYWLLARTWVGRRPMPARLARLYRGFRVIDPLILAAGLVGILVRLPDRADVTVLVLAVWAFGVVEYLNYFVVRLSYPASEWFRLVGERRTPRLVQDVDTAGST